MRWRVADTGIVSVLTVAVLLGACGSDDGQSPDASTGTEATATESAVGTASNDDDSANDASGDPGSSAIDCASIFSIEEIEQLFDEPAMLNEERTESLGQLVCNWETIEDPNDAEDFAYKLLIVQFYSGDPIPAASFFDPSMFESVVTITGVGDLAFSPDLLDATFDFVDDPVGGSLSWSEVDLGNVDAPKLRSRDDIEQLFRTFHERVT